MIFDAALLALLLGLLLGGSLKKLLDMRLRGLWLLAVSVAMSLLPRLPAVGSLIGRWGAAGAMAVALVRYGMLAGFVALNWRHVSVCIIGMGGMLNFLATAANGGRMPVSAAALGVRSGDASLAMLKSGEVANYTVAGAATRLYAICDIFRLRLYDIYFFSLGDLLIALGVAALILRLMEPKLLHRLSRRLCARVPLRGKEQTKG